MTVDRVRRIERRLPGLFEELADARTPDYLEGAIERASSRSQRPAWTLPGRWIPMEIVTTRVPTTRFPLRQVGVLDAHVVRRQCRCRCGERNRDSSISATRKWPFFATSAIVRRSHDQCRQATSAGVGHISPVCRSFGDGECNTVL